MNIQLELEGISQGIDKSKLAAAYSRVSTEKQGKEGHSIKSQIEYAEKYAERNGWELPNCFKFNEEKPATYGEGHEVDEYSIIESFSSRPQLTEILKRAQNREFAHLIVYSRDRLSRVVQDSIVLELFFRRYGVEVHYVKEGDDFGDSSP